MRVAFRIAATLLLFTTLATAQAKSGAASTKQPKSAAAALRSECLESVGLCISVPATWQRLGDLFDGLGFVAAEPRPGVDSATDHAPQPHLTVVAIDVSPAQGDDNSPPPSLDALVDRMLSGEGALASARVLGRSSLLLNGANAQIVRVGLPENGGNAEAIEAVALIEGEEGMVYSIALRCSPADYNRLEPVFRQALQSWRLKTDEAAPASRPPNTKTAPPRTQPKAGQSGASSKDPGSTKRKP